MTQEEFCFSLIFTGNGASRGAHESKDVCNPSLSHTQAYKNVRGVVENHPNPSPETLLLLRGKIVCKNFSFDFCYPNNSSLNCTSNINLIMTPLRHILWRLISNDLQGFTFPFSAFLSSRGFCLCLTRTAPPPTSHIHHQGGKKRPWNVRLKMITMYLGISFNLNFVLFYF